MQLHRRRRCGVDLPADRVRGAFLLAATGDQVVGRVSLRFELDDWLATHGGHIGYGIRTGGVEDAPHAGAAGTAKRRFWIA